jgi:hypothetical protein
MIGARPAEARSLREQAGSSAYVAHVAHESIVFCRPLCSNTRPFP